MINYTLMLNNKSQTDDSAAGSRPETIVIVNCVLNAPLILLCSFGNALLLVATARNPSIRSTSMDMLCSLAVSDLLVGFIAQLLFLSHQLTKEPFLDNLMVLMTAISVDRFLALHFHLRYATLVTNARVKFSIVMIWLFNFIPSVLYFFNVFIYFLIMAMTTIICIITCFVAYLRIYCIVRHHQIQIHAQQQSVESHDAGNSINMMRLKTSALNTSVFFIFFIICYLPMYVLLTLAISNKASWTNKSDFSITVVFLNSSINPFLFCWRLRDVRRIVLKTLRTIFGKQTDTD